MRDSSSHVHSWLLYVNAMRIALVMMLVACGGGGAGAGDDGNGDTPDANGGSGAMADAATTVTSCDGRSAQPKDSNWDVTIGGLARTAKVHVPASYDPTKPTPIVINLHGRTGWAQQQANLSHAIAKSDAEGFVVIHPEATGSTGQTAWNAGGGCCDPAYANDVDDSGFIGKLIDEAAARLCLDPDRVYVMGLSNGGYLSHRVACEHGDRIAAIGPVAGVLSLPGCSPARPMPMMIVHGTSDSIVQYSWEDQTVDFWTQNNGCTTETVTYTQGAASCVTHGGCTSGADVVMCTIDGGGHQWPGGDELPFLGTKSDDLVATDAIWDFFVAHPRK